MSRTGRRGSGSIAGLQTETETRLLRRTAFLEEDKDNIRAYRPDIQRTIPNRALAIRRFVLHPSFGP